MWIGIFVFVFFSRNLDLNVKRWQYGSVFTSVQFAYFVNAGT